MNVLVTGGAGLLGAEVVKQLVMRGDKVTAVDDLSRMRMFGQDVPQDFWINGAECRHASFYSPEILSTLHEYDAVVHCAAQTSHPRSIDIPLIDFEVNTWGTLHMLLTMKELGAKAPKLVHISSAKVYGQNVDALDAVDERCPVGDQTILTPFGVSKLAGDLYVQQFSKLYGIRSVILRPGCFTGEGAMAVVEQNWEPIFVSKIVRGEPLTIYGYGGKQVRDVLHVTDLAHACLLLLDSDAPSGEVYNVGGGQPNAVSMLDAVVMIERMADRGANVRFGPERPGDWKRFVTDNGKVGKACGWRPKISVQDTFTRLVRREAEVSRSPRHGTLDA